MRFGRLTALLFVSSGLGYAVFLGTGCGVTNVKGPDGNMDWFKVGCRREGNCMRKAASKCPGGFLLAESETGSSTFYEKGPSGEEDDSEGKERSMIARCGTEKEEKRTDDDDEPFKPISKPKNLAGCGKAFDQLDDVMKAWMEWHPGAEAPPAKPTRSEFVNVCGDMPETVQFCLVAKYGNSHQDECKEELENVPAKNRLRLVRLFEKDWENPKDMVVATKLDLDAGSNPADAGGDAGKDAGTKPKPGAKPAPDAGVKIPDAGVKKGPSDAAAE